MKAEGQEIRQAQITKEDLLKLPYYLARGIKYHAAGRFYTPKPIIAALRVTYRCNARCIMCLYWKYQGDRRELTLKEIEEIFNNPLFSSIRAFGLQGGEPTLREDLAEIAQTILGACPQVKEISLFTNGLLPDLVLEKVREILALPKIKSLDKFTVSVSLDGYGNVHDEIRRVPQAFERATETIKRLKSLHQETPFSLRSTCVVQPLNVDNLVQLWDFARNIDLPISFVPLDISIAPPEFAAEHATPQYSVRLTAEQLKQLEETFYYRLKSVLPLSSVIFWEQFFRIVGGDKRRLPCYSMHHLIDIDFDGTLHVCGISSGGESACSSVIKEPVDKIWYSKEFKKARERRQKYVCPECSVSCNMAFSLQEEYFYAAKFMIKERIRKLLGK